MNCKRIGGFLRELRREKGLTQEQLAELLGVSGRTVSRWETGANMPDLDLLIQIADFYAVEVREILDGGRSDREVNEEMKETVLLVADYSNEEKQKLAKLMRRLFAVGLAAFSVYLIMEFGEIGGTHVLDFIKGVMLGIPYGAMIIGLLYVTGVLAKFRACKRQLLKQLKKP